MEIEFGVSGSFKQLSKFKEDAEKLGWKYVEKFTLFSEEEYNKNIKPRLLYFCDGGEWNDTYITNGFSLTDSASYSRIVFNLNTQEAQALIAIKYGLKSEKCNEMAEFLDFIVDNYTIEDGNIINDENRVESKEEVVATFKTMYGQTKV